MNEIQTWIDATSKIGFPAVFALILLFKVNPSLEKIADALGYLGERMAVLENEAEIKPAPRKREASKLSEVKI